MDGVRLKGIPHANLPTYGIHPRDEGKSLGVGHALALEKSRAYAGLGFGYFAFEAVADKRRRGQFWRLRTPDKLD